MYNLRTHVNTFFTNNKNKLQRTKLYLEPETRFYGKNETNKGKLNKDKNFYYLLLSNF